MLYVLRTISGDFSGWIFIFFPHFHQFLWRFGSTEFPTLSLEILNIFSNVYLLLREREREREGEREKEHVVPLHLREFKEQARVKCGGSSHTGCYLWGVNIGCKGLEGAERVLYLDVDGEHVHVYVCICVKVHRVVHLWLVHLKLTHCIACYTSIK